MPPPRRPPSDAAEALIAVAPLASRWIDRLLAGHEPAITLSQYLVMRAIDRERADRARSSRAAPRSPAPPSHSCWPASPRSAGCDREPDPADRRHHTLSLSPAGAPRYASAQSCCTARVGELLAGLPAPGGRRAQPAARTLSRRRSPASRRRGARSTAPPRPVVTDRARPARARRRGGCRARRPRIRRGGTPRARGSGSRRRRRSSVRGRDAGRGPAGAPRGRPRRGGRAAGAASGAQPVAVHARGIVGIERLVDRRAGRRRSGDRDRQRRTPAPGLRHRALDHRAHVRGEAVELGAVGRVGVQVALGLAHDADLHRDRELDLGARCR